MGIVAGVMRPAARRVPVSGVTVFVGWVVSVFLAMPAAYIVGIWLSGWEEPPDYIVQGASLNPFYSGAGAAIVLTFTGLVVLATVLWGWVLVRARRRWLQILNSQD